MESDLEKVLRLMLVHQEQFHSKTVVPVSGVSTNQVPDIDEDPARCLTVLRKARKMLPKVMKEISTSAPNPKVLDTLCTLLSLFVSSDVCPFSPSVFSSNAGVILFYMVRFLATPEYSALHQKVFDVCTTLALLLLESDFNGYVHIYTDLIDLLADLLTLESYTSWRPGDVMTVHCFLVAGAHLGRDTTHMKNGLRVCCQRENADPNHAQLVFDMGKKTVPPLTFASIATTRLFSVWMWRFLEKNVGYSAALLSHHPCMAQLYVVLGSLLEMATTPVDAAAMDLMECLLTEIHWTDSIVHLCTAFYAYASRLHQTDVTTVRLVKCLSTSVISTSKVVSSALWLPFKAFATSKRADPSWVGAICSTLRIFLTNPESHGRSVALLVEVVAHTDLSQSTIQQEVAETIHCALRSHTADVWTHAHVMISQFHSEYVANSSNTKRQKVTPEYSPLSTAICFNQYAQVTLAAPPVDAFKVLVGLVLALTYDNSVAVVGLSVLLPLRTPPTTKRMHAEVEVCRMVLDRVRHLLGAPRPGDSTLSLVTLALWYATDDELRGLSILPTLTKFQTFISDTGVQDHVFLYGSTTMQPVAIENRFEQFLVVLCWIYNRHAPLALRDSKWNSALSGRVFLENITNQHPAAVTLAPFWLYVVVQSGAASAVEVWTTLLDSLTPLATSLRPRVAQAAIATFSKLCCTVSDLSIPLTSTQHETTRLFQSKCGPFVACACSQPRRVQVVLRGAQEVLAMLEKALSDATVAQQALLTMAAFMKHMPKSNVPPAVVWRFLDALGHSDPACRSVVETNIGITATLMATFENVDATASQLFDVFDGHLRKNPHLARTITRATATLGASCDLEVKAEGDLFFALLFRLLALWKVSTNKIHEAHELNRMVTSCHLTWKQLFVQHPDRIHEPLVHLLLQPGNGSALSDFLATFLGADVTLAIFLKENAAHILPHLIVAKNLPLLQTVATFHGGGATVSSLVGENILAIVKEMLMQKVTSFNNVAEWDFFFGFIPNDVGIRDVIQHKPLTIIYALAWELAGDRPRVAKKSFIEVCKQFLDDEDNGNSSNKFHISQQFFLAVMTFLGQKLLSKNVRHSIRAIQCTEVLLSLFDSSGDLDNFVPKIMATLKLASQEANEEKILAACRAWRTFVRLLSADAIKANVLSIVVSLLPCIGPLAGLFQQHVAQDGGRPHADDFTEAQQVALEVLRSIFTHETIHNDPSVAFLLALTPSVAVESPIKIRHLPIHEVLQLLIPLLQHWDGAVREVGLLHLIHVLNNRCREVLDLILSLEEGLVHSCIMGVLKELLHLSRLETHDAMQILVAQALGALGAIDMARITPQALRPDTTNELSTKNLACHLIQTLLVKELRAAPHNTDVIALSIQQLLQFLAQLNAPDSNSTAPSAPSSSAGFVQSTSTMPEWMQRQFQSKGVDKIIAPYWSTKYQAPNFKPTTMPASSTFYEALGSVAFDQWLVSWCKYLIDHSTFPERHIFLACRRALTISLEMARFLLPYLVQNVLKQTSSYNMVKQEILSVLQEDSLDMMSDAVSSHHHQCAQTVFSMLDELNDWVWASQRKKIAMSQQPHMAKHIDEMFDQEKEVVEEFLKDIPLLLLSSAAFKIKAYARAIQYFESHLRQQGGAAGVHMTSSDITKMQKMYGSLDEPDALLGLAIQRRWLHPQPTGSFQELQHLIAEHKHLARWEDALACYEQAIHHMHGSDVEVDIRSELYSGVIQCMIQLGRLEGALQHVRGIVNQYPEVIPAVYPCALECAWRLSRWDLLAELTTDAMKVKLDNEDMMGMKFAKAILCFHQDKNNMHVQVREARAAIMGPLAAASQESYQRVYPLLNQLHFLHELEQGFVVATTSSNSTSSKRTDAWNAQCPWTRRDAMMAPALKFQEPILALRRVMMHDLQLDGDLVSANWLRYAKMARKEGLVRTAESAMMHAQALGSRTAIIEQAKLLVERGKMYEALHVLEPIPIDVSTLEHRTADNHFHAKTLLLATNYMQQSSQKQGQHVIDRYKAVIAFDKDYAKGYFCLAKYYEVLLESDRREIQDSTDPYAYLPHVLHNYVLSLKGTDKYLFQSLPRLLTLWYEFGEILQASSKRSYRLDIQDNDGDRLMQDISKIILDALHSLPESMWLVCFPQVTSRICHPNVAVVDGVKAIMVKVLMTFPQRAMWYVLGLAQSLNTQRKTRAIEILKVAQKQLTNSNQVGMANALSEGMRLVEELIKLAEFDPGNQKKMPIRLTRVRAKVLLPIQNIIHRRDLPESDVYIKSFGDKADVMLTKEKPKRIQIQGTDGKTYSFLCKREKHGDLRKDARMMEFNALMNKLLQRETNGRKRKLRLRTYAVICLNEESGLMEWVPNTRAMRHLISQIYKTEQGFLQPVRLTTELKDTFLNMQKQYAHDVPKMTVFYKSKILTHPAFTPRFHQWFLNNFSDPTAWYEARNIFVRSAAVWSMVGHIVGLGDRHGENILIDCTTGECVHVDFDCLFDKGLKLARPEIVPFRLTPNMIDAFGLTGVEGVYRHTCEVTLTLLRANRETLRSILESFVHDPLVEWGRSKNKQVVASALKPIAANNEQVNSEAKIMLKTIDERLRGMWNLGKKQQHETLPLSVKGQVDRLIAEATSNENLAQMYIGWMPFL
ncbi:hypothetical protein H310_09190 [Aphanomyces invadans]|uniref:Serine/threonine-protein kinase ATR n=1 Tax=Aphanomyces invadans TaxID=157072 RepID=A0A024TUL4_9STRA|nr:hypothetical protein H310_09190 [Aphanomyces invadans]ETV97855.1 hypothetical protein H310_09190 [Aphanomyces invadans]|eukprot:XP_008873416.1 hypothetical protein H310_09190 [Aphanomyces invadans]